MAGHTLPREPGRAERQWCEPSDGLVPRPVQQRPRSDWCRDRELRHMRWSAAQPWRTNSLFRGP